MKKYTKKLISMFLSFALLFSTVSTTVFADSVPVTTGDSQAVTEDVNNDNAVSSTSTEAKPDQVTQSSDENAPKQEDTLEVSDATKDALVEDVDDPVKADDKNTEDANAQETEQAETKSPVEDVKYPAWQTEKQLDGGIKVTVKAPEGAFPEGVSVSVTKVDAKLIEQAVDKVAKEKVEAKDITAFDFKFSTSEDSNLEPKLPISVTFTKLDTEENDKLTLFHLKNQTSKAESAQTDVADAKNGKLSFTASDFSIYAIVSTPAATTDGKIWLNGNTATTFSTINEAVAAASNGDVIHLSGNFSENGTAAIGAQVDKAVTLQIDTNTVITGNGGAGITLSNGAVIKTSSGASLTMSGFNTALTVNAGSAINDGQYNLDGNAIGFALVGTGKVEGSSKLALTISAKNSSGRGFTYSSDSQFIGATINVVANNEKSEQYNVLKLKNTSLTTKGVWYYFNPASGNTVLYMDGSEFYAYKATGASAYRQTMTIQGPSEVLNGSTLTSDGSRISVFGAMTVTDSAVVFKNSSAGGLNVNYANSNATFTNSTLTGINMSSTPLYGAGLNDPAGQYIKFVGDSVVNTPASNKVADDGGTNAPAQYIVTGGSFKIAYDKGYNYAVTTPTNGTENGNERLALFTLTDTSVNVLNPINVNGNTYTYNVARASDDGLKHVWTPEAKVTFTLNNANAQFADGTTADKTASTIRGYKMTDVTGNSEPGIPSDSTGLQFLGWFYRNMAGTEKAYRWDDPVNENLNVYAKWDSKSVIYHNGNGSTYVDSQAPDTNSADVLDFDAIVAKQSNFAVNGKTFKYWTADPAGNTAAINPGEKVAFSNGTTNWDLYAQYDITNYTVSFSANGGTFSSDSIFKTNGDVFDITTDVNGGEVAVVKEQATYGQTLHDILGSFDYNQLKPDVNAKKAGSLLSDTTNWYKSAAGTQSVRFDDYKWLGLFTFNGENPTITSNLTYYLGWKDDPNVSLIETTGLELPGDMWGSDKNTTTKVQTVYKGEEFSLTGGVDIKSIKTQMSNIENLFGNPEASTIKLTDVASEFTTVLTIPDGVGIPSNPEIFTDGLGSGFEVTNTKVEGQNVTVTFTLIPGKNDYEKLKTAIDSMGNENEIGGTKGDYLTITVNGLKMDDSVAEAEKLTAVGTVNGEFSATAQNATDEVKKFHFTWLAKQLASGKDEEATDDETIQFTLLNRIPEEISYEGILPGDILIGDDTEHTALHEVSLGEDLTYTGRLWVSAIKDQIEAMKAAYQGDADTIKTEGIKSTFTATLTFPEGLTLPANPTATLTDNNLFVITDVKKDGNAVIVTMSLKKDYQMFSDLYTDVMGISDTLDVKIPNITVATTLTDGTKLTSEGIVTGTFTGRAISRSGKTQAYNFKWESEQTDEGRDFILPADSKAIQYTDIVRVPEEIAFEGILPGDILIGDDTEHTALHEVGLGEDLTYTGRLWVSAIKDQIEAMKAAYQGDADTIKTEGIKSTFTATLTFPEGFTLPANPTATLTDNNLFEITDVKKDGNAVIVTMSLKKDYQMFSDLYTDVTGISDTLDVKIPNVLVDNTLTDGTKLTVTGTVTGTFTGRAISRSGKTQSYNFKWESEQTDDGRDYILPADSKAISYTVVVKVKEEEPTSPSNPDNGNNKPSNPDQGGQKNINKGGDKNIDKGVQKKTYTRQFIFSPKTGDNSNVMLWLLIMLVAVSGIIVSGVKRHKSQKK